MRGRAAIDCAAALSATSSLAIQWLELTRLGTRHHGFMVCGKRMPNRPADEDKSRGISLKRYPACGLPREPSYLMSDARRGIFCTSPGRPAMK